MSYERRRSGQALVLATLALFAMFGIIGLAVDFGWAFYVEKTAQAAADAASLAAAKAAMDRAASAGFAVTSITCASSGISCATTPVDCPSGVTNNLVSACTYAQQNGFNPQTNPRQRVLVQASDASTAPTVQACSTAGANGCTTGVGCAAANISHPPTARCVDTVYWVTVRVTQAVPQLFSALMGNPEGLVSARATAAIAESETIGSLILLDRENELPWDGAAESERGRNLKISGGPDVTVPGGVILSSSANPSLGAGKYAGSIQGSGYVHSPFTYVRGTGQVDIQGASAEWTAAPVNRADGSIFQDPMRGRGQPPLSASTSGLPHVAVPETSGGRAFLNSDVCPGNVCSPGIYYAVDGSGNATGTRVEVPGQTTLTFRSSSGSQFGDYVFFGGMNIGQAVVNFGPGRYVMAGVKPSANGPSPILFDNDNAAQLLSTYSGDSDPGRIFILTDDSYGGRLDATAQTVPGLVELGYGRSSIRSGNNDSSRVQLTGLNPNHPDVPSDLRAFDVPAVIWQDQGNSKVQYTTDGQIETNCALSDGINNPCTSTQATEDSPELEIWATPDTSYDGLIYQPRGAWTVFQAAGDYTGAIQIVSGAMEIVGSASLTLTSPSNPVTQYIVALVE